MEVQLFPRRIAKPSAHEDDDREGYSILLPRYSAYQTRSRAFERYYELGHARVAPRLKFGKTVDHLLHPSLLASGWPGYRAQSPNNAGQAGHWLRVRP